MIKKIFNPFKYIAGKTSLIIGILVLLITAFISSQSNIHFPDTISVKASLDFSLQYYIIQNFANWIIVSVIFYIISIIASKSKVRIIDVFGTQALARFPYLIASFTGFSNSINIFGKYLLSEFMNQGEPIELSAGNMFMAILIMIFTLLLTIWLVTLMYNAFKVSANLKGSKSGLLFTAGLIISIILTSLVTNQLIQIF